MTLGEAVRRLEQRRGTALVRDYTEEIEAVLQAARRELYRGCVVEGDPA